MTAWIVVAGCFAEPDSDDGGDTSGGTGSGDATTVVATTDNPTSGMVDGASSGGPVDDTTGDDDSSGSGTSGAQDCAWPLSWPATMDKDIVLVMIDAQGRGQAGLSNGGLFYDFVASISQSDGTHVAGVVPCPPGGPGCPNDGSGYYFLSAPDTLGIRPGKIEPMQYAADAEPPADFWRDYAPDHYVFLTEADTAWTGADVEVAMSPLVSAQLDIRAATGPGSCASFTGLAALGMPPHNTYVCNADYDGETVFDASVLGAEPSCVLAPMGGPLVPGVQDLALRLSDGNVMLDPPGPVPSCAQEPGGWRLLNASDGPVQLCPRLCRDVSNWVTNGLVAEVTHTCP